MENQFVIAALRISQPTRVAFIFYPEGTFALKGVIGPSFSLEGL